MVSEMLRGLLSQGGAFSEGSGRTVEFPTISTATLELVIAYFK